MRGATRLRGMAWFLLAIGLFALAGGGLNLGFFMRHRKAQFMIRVFGEKGARVFYVLLGAVLVAIGVGLLAGLIPQ